MWRSSAVLLVCVLCCSLPVFGGEDRFTDVTDKVGLTGLGGGVAAWVDVNRDGWPDLYVSGQLWRNDQGRGFKQVADSGLAGSGLWFDFDNDGRPDFFSWEGAGRLFRNLGDWKFEATQDVLPPLPTQISLGAAAADFNGDGYADLYVGGYEVWPDKEFPDVVYLNNKGNRFDEHWRQKTIRRARGITAADFDRDGDVDVYVSNYRLQPNALLRNDGRAGFTDVAADAGAAGDGDLGAWGHTIGSAWGDLDNDGLLDLFVGNFSHPPAYQDRPKFLRNTGAAGDFRFEDQSAAAGLHWQESYASPALCDFDNDGRQDVFFTTVYSGDNSVLYRNLGNWKFENVSDRSGVSRPTTYQAAWADFNRDGSPDLVTGGRLFQNPGGDNHWLLVTLEPGKRAGTILGTQVRLQIGEHTLVRQVESGTGQGNQNDATLHFGLGAHAEPVSLEIRWFGGETQTVSSSVNRVVRIAAD